MTALATLEQQSPAAPMTQEEARACVEQIHGHMRAARRAVYELHQREGWRALGYSSWRECVEAEFDKSQAHLYRELKAAEIEAELSPNGEIGAIPESHLRPLGSLTTEQRQQAWEEANAGDEPRTAAKVEEAAAKVTGKPPKAAPAPAPAVKPGSIEEAAIAIPCCICNAPSGVPCNPDHPESIHGGRRLEAHYQRGDYPRPESPTPEPEPAPSTEQTPEPATTAPTSAPDLEPVAMPPLPPPQQVIIYPHCSPESVAEGIVHHFGEEYGRNLMRALKDALAAKAEPAKPLDADHLTPALDAVYRAHGPGVWLTTDEAAQRTGLPSNSAGRRQRDLCAGGLLQKRKRGGDGLTEFGRAS